jgi:hypothetical protein
VRMLAFTDCNAALKMNDSLLSVARAPGVRN